jgi:hypothetical protein
VTEPCPYTERIGCSISISYGIIVAERKDNDKLAKPQEKASYRYGYFGIFGSLVSPDSQRSSMKQDRCPEAAISTSSFLPYEP